MTAETAWGRYNRLRAERPIEGATGDWSRFCTSPDTCTSPCSDCGAEATRERETCRGQ